MITYFHLIFHVLFHIIQGFSVTWNHVLQIYFLLSSHEATFSAEGWREGGTLEWPLRCLNLNLERENLFILRSNLKEHLSQIVAYHPQVATKNILRQEGSWLRHIFFFKSGFKKKMPEPQDIDHALQTSLPFQGFWPPKISPDLETKWQNVISRWRLLRPLKTIPRTWKRSIVVWFVLIVLIVLIWFDSNLFQIEIRFKSRFV